MPGLRSVTGLSPLCAVAVPLAVSCGPGFNPPPADYMTHVVLILGDKTVDYDGLGSCYAAATLFTYSMTTANGNRLAFSVTMDVGQHPIDGGDTALSQPDIQPDNGSITVNHWNTRGRADGELAATGRYSSVSGHWGCRFDSN